LEDDGGVGKQKKNDDSETIEDGRVERASGASPFASRKKIDGSD